MTSTADATPADTAPSTEAPHRSAPLGVARRVAREVGLGLITLGVIVLLFVAYQLLGTNFTEEHHQASLARQFRAALVTTTTTTAAPASSATTATTAAPLPAPPPGGAIDHLVIPKIGVDKYVVEGTDEHDLSMGPGHYKGTPYPGQDGNVAIAGHRTTYGAPFFRLNELTTGDPIEITDLNDRTWVYKVSGPPQVVSPSDVAVLDPTPFAQLTLTTCNPIFEATSRMIVFARLVGQAMPVTAPAARPVTANGPALLPGANLGHGTSAAWFPAIAYGALMVVLWVLTRIAINRTRRWARLGAYVVGIGICLIPLWFCFENTVRLLPQSI